MGQTVERSVFIQRLWRQGIVARCYAAGETELGDEGNALLDAPMTPWRAYETDALSALERSERGAA